MKLKTSIAVGVFALLWLSSFSYAVAAEIYEVKRDKNVLEVFWEEVKECTWHLSCYSDDTFGTTITTINATDLIKDSRATINTNFSNLNTDKFELSSWFATTSAPQLTTLANLVTVGTLTSGSLGAGFTTVVVARGGTGSTTLSSNQVLLGNGTGNVGVASGYGTSGQFLTSNGVGAAPTWQSASVDQNLDYNFISSAFRVKNLHASSTLANPLILNGVSLYLTNPTQGASSTVLMNDGSGGLTWNPPNMRLIAATTTAQSQNFATTTISSTAAHLKVFVYSPGAGGTPNAVFIYFNSDTSTNYGYRVSEDFAAGSAASAERFINLNNQSTTSPRMFDIDIVNVAANTKQVVWKGTVGDATNASAPIPANGVGMWKNTSSNITSIVVGLGPNGTLNAGTKIFVYESAQ